MFINTKDFVDFLSRSVVNYIHSPILSTKKLILEIYNLSNY